MWGPLENSELIWPVLHINILIIKSNQILFIYAETFLEIIITSGIVINN